MNAVNSLSKVVVCGAAALALTVASSWAVVQSTATARYATDMPTIVILAKAERPAAVHLTQSTTAGLLQ
jgi:hypothetical protein